MIEQMQQYFAAEKGESLVFIVVGVLALAAGGMFQQRAEFLKGLAYPLMAVALIQLTVGLTVYLRTDDQLAVLSRQFEDAPAVYRQQELQRMETVNRNFDRYKRIEIALLLAGVGVIMAGVAKRRSLLVGAGAGLSLQSGVMLALDFFAEARADLYTSQLLGL